MKKVIKTSSPNKFKPSFQLDIGGKLFLAIAGSALLVVSLAFAFIIPMDLSRINDANKEEAQVFVKAFHKNFIRVVFLNTTEEAVDLTEHLRSFPAVKKLTLTNNKGEQLFSYEQVKGEVQSNNFILTNKIYDASVSSEAISYMGQDFGQINLVLSNEKLEQKIQQYFELLVPLILGLVIVAFGVARLLRNYFSKPIIELSEAVNKIAVKRDFSKQLHTSSSDEIGTLCKGFNILLKTVFQTQNSLAAEKEQAIFTLNSITDAVIRTDELGVVEYMNPIATTMTGFSANSSHSNSVETIFSIITAQDKKAVVNPITECILYDKIISEKSDHIMIARNRDGIDVEYSVAPIHDDTDNIIGTVMVFKDVTKSRENSRQLTYMATHDALTNSYNRHSFEKYMERAIDTACNKNHQHILFFMDLDNFKIINDTLGHLAGDEVLRNVALLISNNIRDTDILSRLGGDEFGALLSDCDVEQGLIIAENIRAAVEKYKLKWEGRSYQVTISIGLVSMTSANSDIDVIINSADTACYEAKSNGRNCIRQYENVSNTTSNVTNFSKSSVKKKE